MWRRKSKVSAPPRPFMSALARDKRGNTIALMAAALIPMAALTGSAVDMARLYVVKVRLQQACDAGVLAGRKFMTGSGTTLDATATTQAQAFFNNNFSTGWMTTNTVSFTPSKTSDSQVAGVASAVVPMTIMKMFGSAAVTLNVTCQARYDIGDSDIMFVLDTTGSMSCSAAGSCPYTVSTYTRNDGTTGYYRVEDANSKIGDLRDAVLQFYDTLAANASPLTHTRYGFVTYTSTVNVGYLLPTNYLVTNWTYASRKPALNPDANNNSATTSTTINTSQTTCTARNTGRSPATGYSTSGAATMVTSAWTNTNGGTCVTTTQGLKPNWTYTQVPFDVSQFITGATVRDPSKITGATSKWQGCIEERDTTVSSSFNVNSLPPDLDPDLVPTNDATKWRPMWPDVIYYRGNNPTIDYAGNGTTPLGDFAPASSTAATTQFTNMIPDANPAWDKNKTSELESCGMPAQRLATMTRAQVSAYVNNNDFRAFGTTYHDTGMIWGTRLLSPTGIFASDTSTWPGHQPPNRYIVFMTDGDMNTVDTVYGLYGMEKYDKRVAGATVANDTAYHNTRFTTECAAAKARNIKVFVIGFGQALTSELTTCASPNSAYYASDTASLNAAFTNIANQVATLRITQ